MSIRNRLFYALKPLVPRTTQLDLRRALARRTRRMNTGVWPIDPAAGRAPVRWKGWPEGKRFAFVLMHDVDTLEGQRKTRSLLDLDGRHGFRSSFNFVPERYRVSKRVQRAVRESGCEIGVHGLRHDGKLFSSRSSFSRQAERINAYLAEWGSVGFSSPSMLRNLEWTIDLDIAYDISTFDTDPFEPQPDAARTIFPFLVVNERKKGRGFVELPYTLPQDHCLFVINREKDIQLWKEKLEWLVEKGGMALVNCHPDYMRFDKGAGRPEEYRASLYAEFLNWVRNHYRGRYWNALPREVAAFWMQNMAHHKTGPDLKGLKFRD